MKIDIPDDEVQAILTGLQSGDSVVVSRFIHLLQKEVESQNRYPFAVSLDGKYSDSFSSLESIKEEFDGIEHDRLEIYHRVRGVKLRSSEIWQG